MERVNIIGAGLAGLSAAITLAKSGICCALISSQPSERAQSVMAEGGINAALDTMGEGDTADEHFADTMRGGVYLADPNAVEGLTKNAPEILRMLHGIGVPFQYEDGHIILRSFGGQKKKRTAYAKSSTGKVIMTALIDEARKYEAKGLIERFPHHTAEQLELSGGRCVGVTVIDDYTDERYIFSGKVIAACGGLNGIFPEMTTGTTQNTGNFSARLFCQGVEFANLEFIQFHPTTAVIQGKRMLISEAARGEGGRLFVERGGSKWYFMEELYPELGNLMPRDVVSREMYRVCRSPECGDRVYLDMTGLSADTWRRRLSDLRAEIIDYLGVDPAKEPVAVSPGIHFFMGGINTDESHATNIEGLYAAGECACQYHGANRLGGNSMLGAIYGGSVAAKSAAKSLGGEAQPPASLGKLTAEERRALTASPSGAKALRDILLSGLGIIRDEEGLSAALARLGREAEREELTRADRERLCLGQAMLLSARSRKESRGAHTRSDYPDRDDEHFRRTTTARLDGGSVQIGFAEIPERRGEHGGIYA